MDGRNKEITYLLLSICLLKAKKKGFYLREEIFHRTVICKRNLENKKINMPLSLL